MTRSEPRTAAPTDLPVALTIAGSDSGGGAGIQADLATMAACGAYGTSAITAVTAQNTCGVERSHPLPVREVAEQIEAVLDDFDVRAVKTGMLATAPIVGTVARTLGDADAPLVVDPVMVAASGDRLLDEEAEAAYDDLIGHATLVTPNHDEAGVLSGVAVDDAATAAAAADALCDRGADAALVTGGHGDGDVVRDVLVADADAVDLGSTGAGADGVAADLDEGIAAAVGADRAVRVLAAPRVDTDATHGSGCTLSSAVAAHLAGGAPLGVAVDRATALLQRAVRYHHDVGDGPGTVNHLVELRERADRAPTAAVVAGLVDDLTPAIGTLLPEVGTNVVGATRAAEHPGETAAVEGRIHRTSGGAAAPGGVRFGASGHVSRFLLGVREHDPTLRFACNLRNTAAIRAACEALDGAVATYDRADQPDTVRDAEGRTMAWAADEAFAGVDGTPVAVHDPGAVGKEPMVKLLAADASALRRRVEAVRDDVGE